MWEESKEENTEDMTDRIHQMMATRKEGNSDIQIRDQESLFHAYNY